MNVKVQMRSPGEIIRRKGLDKDGRAQRFHTSNVLRRIAKYMPYRTGATIKLTIAQTDLSKPYIVTDTPYAKYLYYGKAMAGRAPKHVTDHDLNYTRTKNQRAGPYWDRALKAAEGDAIAADLQRYINRGGKT